MAFERMEGTHANKGAFIKHLGYFPGELMFRFGDSYKEVFTIHPGIKASLGMATCNGHRSKFYVGF
jgi:hypothetical protein